MNPTSDYSAVAVIDAKDTSEKHIDSEAPSATMSLTRRLSFYLSLFVPVLFYSVFLWGLPCDSVCPNKMAKMVADNMTDVVNMVVNNITENEVIDDAGLPISLSLRSLAI